MSWQARFTMAFMHIKQHKRGFGKRGTWVFADLIPWLFYLPMTAAVIFFLVTVPLSILQTQTETHNLENAMVAERAFSKISYYDADIGRIYPGVVSSQQLKSASIENAFIVSLDARKTAIKLNVARTDIYFNKLFYEIAKPLAPAAYYEISAKKQINVLESQQAAALEIDEVFSKKWGQ